MAYRDVDDSYSEASSDSEYEDSEFIEDILQEYKIWPHTVRRKFERQGLMGEGKFDCTICTNRWTSKRAHIVVNFRTHEIVRLWRQKCMECDTENEPQFDDDRLTEMMEKAAERYLKLVAGTYETQIEASGGGGGPPHLSDLCEKCGYGRTKCWL